MDITCTEESVSGNALH